MIKARADKNKAETVWVDPDPQNEKAIALYKKLGFEHKDMPKHIIAMGEDPANIYMELRFHKNLNEKVLAGPQDKKE